MTDFASCNHTDSWLSLAVDDELSPGERARLERHLSQCVPCASRHEKLLATDRVLATQIREHLDTMEAALVGRLVAERLPSGPGANFRRLGVPLAVAASVSFVVLGWAVATRWSSPTPAQDPATPATIAQRTPEVPATTVPTALGSFSWESASEGLRVIHEDGRVVTVVSPTGHVQLLASNTDAEPLLLDAGDGVTLPVLPGSTLAVSAGSLDLALADGATATFTAGSRFRVDAFDSSRRVLLDAGEVACRGRAGSRPIAVSTAVATVDPSLDAGAWFSVYHAPATPHDGPSVALTRVASLRGSVWVSRLGSGTPVCIAQREDGIAEDVEVTASRLTVNPELARSPAKRSRELPG
ncbi:MAG: anti-sigma factor, partial [Planctomycetota bacterium]